jgi:hypothetical protein
MPPCILAAPHFSSGGQYSGKCVALLFGPGSMVRMRYSRAQNEIVFESESQREPM